MDTGKSQTHHSVENLDFQTRSRTKAFSFRNHSKIGHSCFFFYRYFKNLLYKFDSCLTIRRKMFYEREIEDIISFGF